MRHKNQQNFTDFEIAGKLAKELSRVSDRGVRSPHDEWCSVWRPRVKSLGIKLKELEKIIEVLNKYGELEDIVIKLEMAIIKEGIF